MDLLQEILIAVITCVIPILALNAERIIKTKQQEISNRIVNDHLKDAFNVAVNIIEDVTMETTGTYVDALKKAGKFDKEAQQIALKMSVDKAKHLISTDGVEAINTFVGDLDTFIVTKIESFIRSNK